MYFEYFDTETINDSEVVDIWKKIDITDFIDDTKIIYHTLNESENLMDISFKYYDNIDDWWIIYLYNNLTDINFNILATKVIERTQNKYVSDIINYPNITTKSQLYIRYLLTNYFKDNGASDVESIQETNNLINIEENRLNNDFHENFKLYIYDSMINSSYYRIQLKIPDLNVVYKIKNEFERLSIIWKNK